LYRGGLGERPEEDRPEEDRPTRAPVQQQHFPSNTEYPNIVMADYVLNELGTEPIQFQLDADEPLDSSFLEKEASTPLYKGCKTNKLAFILMWQKICARHSLTQVAQDDILGLFGRHVLDPTLDPKMPLTRTEAQTVITNVGLDYETIDACPCDEVLYFGENVNALVCPKCKTSHYREDFRTKKVPRKVRHLCTLYFWDFKNKK
jgi:hypothetical protein